MPIVGLSALPHLLAFAEASGASRRRLCAEAGLDPALFDDPDNRVPYPQATQLYEAASRATDDRAFGLRMAERFDVRQFGPLGYAVSTSSTLKEAAERLARYHAAFTPTIGWRLQPAADEYALVYSVAAPGVAVDELRQFTEFGLAFPVLFARRRAGDALRLRAIEFRHQALADGADYARIFGCPVHFGCAANRIVADLRTLELALPDVDHGLSSIIGDHFERLLQQMPAGDRLVDRIARLLVKELPTARASLEYVAAQLHVSTRTLQRRLADQQTSLSALLDDTRRNAAANYAEQGLGAGEIAYLVGLSDARALQRAFKRWTGQTVAQYRRHAAAGRPGRPPRAPAASIAAEDVR